MYIWITPNNKIVEQEYLISNIHLLFEGEGWYQEFIKLNESEKILRTEYFLDSKNQLICSYDFINKMYYSGCYEKSFQSKREFNRYYNLRAFD